MKIGLEIVGAESRKGVTTLGAVFGCDPKNWKEAGAEREAMAADTDRADSGDALLPPHQFVGRLGIVLIGEAAQHGLGSIDPRGPKSGCSSRDESGRHVEHEARAKMTGSGCRPLKLAMLSDIANQRYQQERPVREHGGVKDAPHHAAAALAGLVGRRAGFAAAFSA